MEKTYSRIQSIDFLRGIVLILMLLDHVRFFFSSIDDPLSLIDSTPVVFFTRWVTHLCAPAFIFLAGISVYLYAYRANHGIQKTSYFLLTRGLWFVFLEFTLMFFVWTFFLVPYRIYFQIFGVIGLSMMVFAALIFLPTRLIFIISLLLIICHNLFDPISASTFGDWSWLWMILHEDDTLNVFGLFEVHVGYPLIPWVGVLGLGYCMGEIFLLPESSRRKVFFVIGLVLTIFFIALRYLNEYGDPLPWTEQGSTLLTTMSFLNTHKYPPSLLYLLMTLGPVFMILGLVTEKICSSRLSQMIITFGRVPFFFYVTHIALILAFAIVLIYFREGMDAVLHYRSARTQYGYDIEVVYLVSVILLISMYYPCVWYGKLKARSKKWYFSYL